MAKPSLIPPALGLLLIGAASCSTKDDPPGNSGSVGGSPGSGGMTTSTQGGGTATTGGSGNGGSDPGQGGGNSGGLVKGGAGGGGGAPGTGGTSDGGSSAGGSGGNDTAKGGSPATGGSAGASTGGSKSTGGSGGGTTTGGAGGATSQGGSAGGAGKSSTGGSGGGTSTVTFKSTKLSGDHTAEGADVGDIDGDGVVDLVAGPTWYKGPSFTAGGKLFDPVPTYKADQYSKFFLTFVDDLDGDTRPDVIGIGDAGGGNGTGTPNTHWYKNPGPSALTTAWAKYPLYSGLVANESPVYANLVGTARKELIFMTDRALGYAEPGATATDPWTFKSISGSTTFNTPYVHGLGVGDLNGDGKADIVERSGWWQQPATAGGSWTRHAVDFGVGISGTRPGNWGGAQMAVYDVDGDGDGDVITALAAHGYGLSWFEQVSADQFTPHVILPASATGMSFSQQHALTVADINGDGLLDFVTGKRYYAHPSTNPDPGTTDPPVIYWFELKRTGGVSFTPHQIHNDSGAGCNFPIGDFTGDGKPDIFTTNKRGTFLHTQG